MSAATLTKLSRALNRQRPEFAKLPGVLLLTDEKRLPDPLPAAAALPRGSGIILRHYDSPERTALGHELMALCRRRNLRLLIAGDLRLAWHLGAHGVHLPQWQLYRLPVQPCKPGWLITAAVHDRCSLTRANSLGLDAVLLSPVFATASHPGAPILGGLHFAQLSHGSATPVYALGGITAGNACRLKNSGGAGIAAISGLTD